MPVLLGLIVLLLVALPHVSATARQTSAPLKFDSGRAYEHLRRQVAFGPRPAGSAALAQTRQYIIAELKSAGLSPREDAFDGLTPVGPIRMVNIIATIPGRRSERIAIASHYDTKLFRDIRFVGASDGASSTAALIELARVLKARSNEFTIELLFFDGEEAFCEGWDECSQPENPDNTYGSRHYVSQLTAKNEVENTYALILLDMMGYKNLELGRDSMSTRWLQDIVWDTGRALGYDKVFLDREEGVGGDDHEPFLAAGVASVDIIQLTSYPHWHRADDTIDKVSAQSMKIVGETILASLPKITEHVTQKGTKE